MVYDSEVDDSQSSPHKVPPSCILASMKAKIDIFGSKYGKSLLPSTSYGIITCFHEFKSTNSGNLQKKNTTYSSNHLIIWFSSYESPIFTTKFLFIYFLSFFYKVRCFL